MRSTMRAGIRVSRSVLLLAVLLRPVFGYGADAAARPAGDAGLPAADKILVRSREALGGVPDLERHTSMYVKGVITVPSQKLSGRIEQYTAPPNRFLTSYSVPGLREFTAGHDGRVAWYIDRTDTRLFEGRELKDLLL